MLTLNSFLLVEIWDYHSNGAHKMIGDLSFTIDELES